MELNAKLNREKEENKNINKKNSVSINIGFLY